jgi:hypothetical protein
LYLARPLVIPFLPPYEKASGTARPESPKSTDKTSCLSGFQVSYAFGNVKTAEVKK